MEKLDRASSFTESLKFSYFSIDFSDEEGPQSGKLSKQKLICSQKHWAYTFKEHLKINFIFLMNESINSTIKYF